MFTQIPMTLYNDIGQGYNHTRKPDPRIVDELVGHLALPPGKTIADVGAGTGNYSRAIAEEGYQVIAIEPSEIMQGQAQPHSAVSWITATAESIPLDDQIVDGAIVMLALHHFQDIAAGISEINRIVTAVGRIVIFAFEQSKIPDFWLGDYFPYFVQDTLATFPSLKAIAQQIKQITQKQVEIIPFLLPPDLTDLFAAAGWQKPAIYLNPSVRNGISTFAKMPLSQLNQGVNRLAFELDSGVWQQKYGHIQQQQQYDAGYRLIVIK